MVLNANALLIIPKFISRLDFSSELQTSMSNCLFQISSWKSKRHRELNISKTTSNHSLQTCCTLISSYFRCNVSILPTTQVTNLVVIPLSHTPIQFVEQSYWLYLQNLFIIYFSPSPLPWPYSEPLSSHMDYCNTFPIGLHDATLIFLQLIFKIAAGMILLKYITSLLKTPKWLIDCIWFDHLSLLWSLILLACSCIRVSLQFLRCSRCSTVSWAFAPLFLLPETRWP